MKRIYNIFLLAILSAITLISCGEKPEDAAFDVQFSVPATMSVNYDATEMEFRVMFGKAPLKSDIVIIGDPTGKLHNCAITSVSEKSF
jgi:hypothetical protein